MHWKSFKDVDKIRPTCKTGIIRSEEELMQKIKEGYTVCQPLKGGIFQ